MARDAGTQRRRCEGARRDMARCNSIRRRMPARRARDRSVARFPTIQSAFSGDKLAHDDVRREAIVDTTEAASDSTERRAPLARVVSRGVGLVRVDRRRTRRLRDRPVTGRAARAFPAHVRSPLARGQKKSPDTGACRGIGSERRTGSAGAVVALLERNLLLHDRHGAAMREQHDIVRELRSLELQDDAHALFGFA